ncbi:FAD-dependent oxidoreductase [Adhaeribacter sp. BT258]|uniref:NADH:ubiquinone reductase (non-electrogenic) n=1 Tax=Adhaeribacter terrigena TaxID=2793070 RepID=A0ABS1BZE9_9BACT|nr:NAD(P)/FAD-dependent oxidoreductase [Adhaeribacter terrigena]MBK0401645.1 FAD-dependent oxidoreductase [Adhaeribacter terrigena]
MNVNIPATNLPRVVVIGCGFGGLELVKKLRHAPVQVVLLDRNNYHNFQPLLYQVATGSLEPDTIVAPIRKMFKGQKNFIYRYCEVTRINAGSNQLETNIGPISYDYLVIATGSQTNFFGNKTIEKAAMQIKTIPSALNLRSYIFQNFEKALLMNTTYEKEELMNVVVVGGGPTGVEVSGAIAELKANVLPKDYPELDFRSMQVYLIEAGPVLLNGMSAEASAKAKEYLEEMDVHVWINAPVEKYEDGKVYFGQGQSIHAETLIWAAGVSGTALPGLQETAVAKNQRINVNQFNKVEGYENIFAIGDCAQIVTEDTPRGHPMVAPVAMQQAKLLAKNLVRILNQETPENFVYHNQGAMATVGRNKAVVDLPKFKFQGFFAWLVWLFVHLMSLAGHRNRVITFFTWVWNYFTYDQSLRLIIRPYWKEPRKKKGDASPEAQGNETPQEKPQPLASPDLQSAKPAEPLPPATDTSPPEAPKEQQNQPPQNLPPVA